VKTPFFSKNNGYTLTNGNGIYARGLYAISPFVFRLLGMRKVATFEVEREKEVDKERIM